MVKVCDFCYSPEPRWEYHIIAGNIAVTLRWIIILVFPFNMLPEGAV